MYENLWAGWAVLNGLLYCNFRVSSDFLDGPFGGEWFPCAPLMTSYYHMLFLETVVPYLAHGSSQRILRSETGKPDEAAFSKRLAQGLFVLTSRGIFMGAYRL